MPSSSRSIVVLESRSRWEPELQRQFRQDNVLVRGRRTWKELTDLVARSARCNPESSSDPIDVVVIALPEDAAAGLQWLGATLFQSSPPIIIVILDESSAELEWTLREIGVREVFIGDPTGERLADRCRRCWN